MPISVTGNKRNLVPRNGFTALRRSAENGFTLIELMVVIAIIAIASATVILTMPEPGGRVRGEAEILAARATAAREAAIVQARDVSIWVTADSYGTARRQRGVWRPMSERPFEPGHWKPGTTALVDATGTARAAFDTTGAVNTPVIFTLSRKSDRATVTIAGDGSIRVGS